MPERESQTMSRRFANEVRAEVARQGKTQEAIGRAVGLGQVSVSRRLSTRTPFTIGEAQAFAKALNLPLSTLIRKAEQ